MTSRPSDIEEVDAIYIGRGWDRSIFPVGRAVPNCDQVAQGVRSEIRANFNGYVVYRLRCKKWLLPPLGCHPVGRAIYEGIVEASTAVKGEGCPPQIC